MNVIEQAQRASQNANDVLLVFVLFVFCESELDNKEQHFTDQYSCPLYECYRTKACMAI